MLWPWSFFKFYICITDSDQVADTDGDGDNGDATFFKSAPIAQDLDVSEGMLLVNYMLSWANNITHIFMVSRLGSLKLTLFFSVLLQSHLLSYLPKTTGAEPTTALMMVCIY